MPIATKSSKIDISKEIITQKIAEKIASKVSKNTTLLFYGNIGVGKTTFIRHLINYLQIKNGLETFGLGTGAAVADIDGDGILELLVSHGETGLQPLTLYKADIDDFNYIRIKPLSKHGAPARGATVTLKSNKRIHSEYL